MNFEWAFATAALGSARLIGLFAVAPIFGHPAVPGRIRVSLSMATAFALGIAVTPAVETQPLLSLAQLSFQELLVGLTLGFATRLVFAGFGIMGELISIQGGLGAATTVDPSSQSSSLALASLLQLLATLVFLSMDGHHAVIRTVSLSLEQFPVGAGLGLASSGHAMAIVALGADIFEIAMRMAAPITAAMFIANLAVGLLGRIMPQINLMTVQLPALVILNLALLVAGAGIFVSSSSEILVNWLDGIAYLAASGR